MEIPTHAQFARLDKQEELEDRLDQSVEFIQNTLDKIEANDQVLEKHTRAVSTMDLFMKKMSLWNNYDKLRNLEDIFISNPKTGDHLVFNGTNWVNDNEELPDVLTKTSDYTVIETDGVILCNGTLTITLLTAVNRSGDRYHIKNIGTGTVTIATNGTETIDGASSFTITTQYDNHMLVSDGSNWFVL